MTKRIQGILFDLGDTLIDFGKLNIDEMFQQGAVRAYAYLKELEQPLPSFKKFYRHQYWSIRWNYLKAHLTGREFNSLELITDISLKMGQKLSNEQRVELAWKWYEPLREVSTIEDNLRQTLQQLADSGLKLGIVSNTFVPGEILDRHLTEENLIDLVGMRVYSCDVRYRKPNPKIFKIALERLGLAAESSLFVGDSIKADIGGSNRAGLISVLKDPSGRYDNHRICPAHRIRRINELPDIVAQYNGSPI